MPTSTGETRRAGRAAPLSAAERRAAIVAATIPLLRDHGLSVSTRQIAEAAGVAEGTLFSVFQDKAAVIEAAVDAALDPAPTVARLAAIDPELPLERRLTLAVELVQERMAGVWQLLPSVPPDEVARRKRMGAAGSSVLVDLGVLAALFEPTRADLRVEPATAAQLLFGLIFASSHPVVVGGEPMPAAEIVALVLDGIRRRP